MSLPVNDPQQFARFIDQSGRLTVEGQQYLISLAQALREAQEKIQTLEDAL